MHALLLFAALAADAGAPHPHQGTVPKITGTPAAQVLSPEEEAKLAAGQPVHRKVRYPTGDGGRGIAVFDVQAPVSDVWATILDFSAYPTYIDKVAECGVYRQAGGHIYVRFKLDVLGVEYFIDHTYAPERGYMSWQLDYSRQSDLDDSVGYWLVREVPGRPGWTRVDYSVDLRVTGWVPQFVQDLLVKQGLQDATSWLRKHAEARAGG